MGVYSDENLLAITGLFAIVSDENRETQARTFCGIFDPKNFGLKIASRVMPIRSWYGLIERDLDVLTSYIAADNTRSLRAVTGTGYVALGETIVPGTRIAGRKLFQFNPRLGLDMVQELAAKAAEELGGEADESEVRIAHEATVKHLEIISSKLSTIS